MIFHDSKFIHLGHGDVSVGESMSGLTFQNIKPEHPVGTIIMRNTGDIEFLGPQVVLDITSILEFCQFSDELERVKQKKQDFITYKDWVIKFNKNEKSLMVVDAHFRLLKSRVMMLLAC